MVQQERTVVVGVDGSPEALEAARFAALEAEVRGATLVLAHAVELGISDATFPVDSLSVSTDSGRQLLQETQAQLPVSGARRVRLALEVSSSVALLQRLAEEAELVVVGHRHVSVLEKLFGGSVSGPVAAHAHCPVVVVPAGWTGWSAGEQPVVVALDGESPARSGLEVAFASAERLHVDLVVLHAAAPSRFQYLRDEDRANIGEILAGVQADHPDVVVRMVRVEAEPEEAIVAAAGTASLLVVGRPHGETRFGFWTRSVANAVLARIHCPVAVASDPSASAGHESTGSPHPESVG